VASLAGSHGQCMLVGLTRLHTDSPAMNARPRSGRIDRFTLVAISGAVLLVVLGTMLWNMGQPTGSRSSAGGDGPQQLMMFCAAGIRGPVVDAARQYEEEYGVKVQLNYGGSGTLLSQLKPAATGDLYLAADESYTNRARDQGLVAESISLARMKPVIAVKKGNPKKIHSIDDLLRDDVRTALGNPDQAAIGKRTRKLLTASGHWDRLNEHVTRIGVFLPTVPEAANTVKIGSTDAAIIWDTTVLTVDGLEACPVPELDKGEVLVTVGVLNSSSDPTATLRFARYLASRDKGLVHFKKHGFRPVDGDAWAEAPVLTFYCGAVNRRAVEPVIEAFKKREGVDVRTVYDGCGILTGQMKIIRNQQQGLGFPDTYMACDVYYLEMVKEWFQDAVNISDTEVVIAVPKGNPKNIRGLKDLTRPGMRVAVGQPKQCTIGVLTRKLLEAEGVLDPVMANVETETTSSSYLITPVVTGHVDASLAYAADTKAESDKIDTVRIESPAAKAIQPFSIARSSNQKYLGRRLFRAISNAQQEFEAAGFHWRLDAPGPDGTKASD